MSDRMLNAALRYAARNWHVFPVRVNEKRPATDHGLHDATTDEEQIRAWWSRAPFNIGVATGAVSGIFVVDVDDGDAGIDSLVSLGHGFPSTLTQHTPSGGLHLVFAYPAEVRNTARKFAPSLDTRGDGGYIVVAPSMVDGVPYRWVGKGDPRPVPGWLLRLVRPAPERRPKQASRPKTDVRGYAQAALEGERQTVATCPPGNRNHTLNAAAFALGTLVATGALNADEVEAVLFAAAMECGLGRGESEDTIKSGLTSGMKHPREAVNA